MCYRLFSVSLFPHPAAKFVLRWLTNLVSCIFYIQCANWRARYERLQSKDVCKSGVTKNDLVLSAFSQLYHFICCEDVAQKCVCPLLDRVSFADLSMQSFFSAKLTVWIECLCTYILRGSWRPVFLLDMPSSTANPSDTWKRKIAN